MNFHTLLLQIISCGYTLAKLLKTTVFPHKTKVEISHKSNLTKISTNYCRKYRKFAKFIFLHNRIQISENFSPIIPKIWHFLKCHSNCSSNKCKLLLHKNIRAAISCSFVYCERKIQQSATNTLSSLQTHYCVEWCYKVNRHFPQNTKQIN